MLLGITELQLCEGKVRGVRCMNLASHTQTHTHKEEERRNPVMGEMREGVGSVTAWFKDGGQPQ